MPSPTQIRYLKCHWFWPKIWPIQTARGKNFGDMFFDVFRRAEQESEVRLPKKCLVAEISNLLTLFVRDCIQDPWKLHQRPDTKMAIFQNSVRPIFGWFCPDCIRPRVWNPGPVWTCIRPPSRPKPVRNDYLAFWAAKYLVFWLLWIFVTVGMELRRRENYGKVDLYRLYHKYVWQQP